MGARRAPLLQACEVVGDLPRRRDLPSRAARSADRDLIDHELTIASFNAHWGRGYGGSQRVGYDLADAIRGFGADVVVVAEAWRPHGEACAFDALRAEGYAVEELRFTTLCFTPRSRVAVPGEGWWELAVVSRYPVVERRELPLGRAPRDRVGRRSALALTLDVRGVPLALVALHVSSQLWYGGALWHLARLRPQLPGDDVPVVVAGDCNLWGPGVVALLRGYRRAVRGRTFPAHHPHSQIDHVLVNDRVTVLGGEVLPANHSDHRPVLARLRIG